MWQSLEPPSSTPNGDRHMCPLSFCPKFNAQQLLFKASFNTIRIFGCIEPNVNLLSLFGTL